MSDKRTTYAIGAIVVVFALVFGTVAGSTSMTTISVSSLDPMQMTGHAIITLADADGNIIAYRQTDNIVTNVGRNCSADLLFGIKTGAGLCAATATQFTFIGIGSGLSTLVETDTTLGAEISTGSSPDPARDGTLDVETTASGTLAGTDLIGAKKSIKGAFTIGTSSAVDEVGLFDAATSGNMFSRLPITPEIPVESGDTITITYTITVG